MTDIDVPVLIAGGGGAGLTASMLLSRMGIESLLVSASPRTSVLPKAHVLNLRAMAGGRPIDIEVDGGVTSQNAGQVAAAGANALVAGSAVFKGNPDAYRANIAAIRSAAAMARGEAA